jgi:hypothetical protein
MHVGGDERADEPLQETALHETSSSEPAPSSPPPLPATSATEPAFTAPANVSTAPPRRPRAPPAHGAASAASSPPVEGAAERNGVGFTSVIRHLSLRGWLRWIYTNGSDAAIRVRTRAGGSGNIWCSAGSIVDADWGQLTAERALHEMLQLSSGAVTIDFDPVDRPHRIVRPMHELLRAPMAGPGRVSDVAQLEAALAASPPGTPVEQPFRNSLFAARAEEGHGSHATPLRGWPAAHRLRAEYFGGGVLLAALVLAAFAFGRLRGAPEGEQARAPEPERAQHTKSLLPPPSLPRAPAAAPGVTPTPRELPVISFAALESEPANTEIWLDQALAGVGRLELAPMPDGAMHELRFVAPGYETRSLYFVGAPPAGRVLLERTVARVPVSHAIGGSQPDPAANEPVELAAASDEGSAERAPAKGVPHRRASPAAPSPPARARERGPSDDSPSVAKATQAKTSPQVQVIEARTPRVQVLE